MTATFKAEEVRLVANSWTVVMRDARKAAHLPRGRRIVIGPGSFELHGDGECPFRPGQVVRVTIEPVEEDAK